MSYGNVPPPECLGGIPERRDLATRKSQEEAKVKEYDSYSSKMQKMARQGRDANDEAYFNSSDDEQDTELASTSKQVAEEDDEDELDAFMAGINEQAKKEAGQSKKREEQARRGVETSGGRTGRDDIEKEDMEESYYKFLEDYKERHPEEEDGNIQYDIDGNVIWTWKKHIDPLPTMNHSTVTYAPFVRDCYEEHADIAALSPVEVFDLRTKLDIRVFGNDPPKPCVSFAHFGMDAKIVARLAKFDYTEPTPIQAQAIPAALSGRDVLGLARTGSGKTLAYLLPSLIHILSQRTDKRLFGPVALVVVPTRELALQIYEEARVYYAHLFGLSVVCAYGGGNKYEQQKAMQSGVDICVCTPGRIIDLIKIEATDFLRTSFLVFDEADRMFDLGFGEQVRSISDHVRPDRQCLMFSATFAPRIEKLASYALSNPVKVLVGETGEANADVIQVVHVMPNADAKWNWLFTHVVEFCATGKVLVFVTKKLDAENVAEKLKLRSVNLVLLHGDMLQFERNERITQFKAGVKVLVATDVAARGLDIAEIKTVVNFDVARDIDTHVHRIGRTGRAGQSGHAHTLLLNSDREFAGPLAKSLENAGQEVPPALLELAKTSKWHAEHATSVAAGGAAAAIAARSRGGLGYDDKTQQRRSAAAGGGGADAETVARLSKPSPSASKAPTLNKAMEKAKGVAESTTGVSLSKYDIMRKSLKASFQGTFTAATEDDKPPSNFTPLTPALPPSSAPAKKKSRWQ